MKRILLKIIIIIIFLININPAYAAEAEFDFFKLFDDNGAVMLVVDVESGSIRYANKAASRFYGYTVDQLESMNIVDINTLSSDEIKNKMRVALQEEGHFVFDHQLSDGELKTVEVFSCPHDIGGSLVLLSTIHDITDVLELERKNKAMTKGVFAGGTVILIIMIFITVLLIVSIRSVKRKNRKLKSYNELKQVFIDSYDSLIYLKDEELKYVFANKAVGEFYGINVSEISGYTDYDLSSEKFAERRRSTDLDVLDKMTVVKDKVFWGSRVYKSTKFPVRLEDGKYGVGAYIEDITESHNSKQRDKKRLIRNQILVNVMSRNFSSTQEQLDYALHESIKLTESSLGYIYLYNEYSKEFALSYKKDDVVTDDLAQALQQQLHSLKQWDEVVSQKKPIIVNDFCIPELTENSNSSIDFITRLILIPIIIDEKIVGIVLLANKEDDYDYNDVYQITVLANGVWHAVKRREAMVNDSLTGLLNRLHIEKEQERLDTAENLPLSILIGDMNGLKLANDIFGHSKGDLLLKKVAQTIKRVCRSTDTIGRIGGDEFLILMPNTSFENAKTFMQEIKEEFAKEKVEAINGSISLGCATKVASNEDIQQTIETAEERMYRAKSLDRVKSKDNVIKTIIDMLHKSNDREKEHTARISSICESIGRAMNLPEMELRSLKEASYFHDIGKIALDRELLCKIEPLNDEEVKTMRRHVTTGYRILNSFGKTMGIAETVLAHHERWDGSGYPKGLKGDEIPINARIIAIAEYYDAMTNPTYGSPMASDAIIRELELQAGKMLDPQIVNILIEVISKSRDG